MHFDHAGIATDGADELAALFRDLCGCEVAHRETFDGMEVIFLDVGDGYFELLEPRANEEGAIATYLDSNGPGLHHLALATEDIAGALDTAIDLGITCIDEEPRDGAWGHDVAFLHPADTGGVLLEFVAQ